MPPIIVEDRRLGRRRVDEKLWRDAGKELREVDPYRFARMLELTHEYARLHRNPDGYTIGQEREAASLYHHALALLRSDPKAFRRVQAMVEALVANGDPEREPEDAATWAARMAAIDGSGGEA